MNLKERANKLKTDIPAIFIALKNKKTPLIAKIFAVITICYALSPIDIIPDFIPILGYFDDLILLPLLVALTIKLIPKNLFAECQIKSKNLWNNDKPKKWFYAIPIFIIWLFVLIWIIKSIMKK